MGILKRDDLDHPDPRIRLHAVEAADNELELVPVAIRDEWPRVRMAAVAKIRNDLLLARVVREAKEFDVRVAAAERIRSERLLADLIRESGNAELMGVCFSRISDREVIRSIAEDTRYGATARKLAIEHFADEGYHAELEEERERAPDEKVDAMLRAYGGGLRGVRAIGRFRRSEKALHALGIIARRGGEEGGLAVEYLCRALASLNAELRDCAAGELVTIRDPELVGALIRGLDSPVLRSPVREVLAKIDTPEARAALGE